MAYKDNNTESQHKSQLVFEEQEISTYSLRTLLKSR